MRQGEEATSRTSGSRQKPKSGRHTSQSQESPPWPEGQVMRRFLTATAVSIAPLAFALAPALARAEGAPQWTVTSVSRPTNFRPGDHSGEDSYRVTVTNTGGAPATASRSTSPTNCRRGLTPRSRRCLGRKLPRRISKAPLCGPVSAASCCTCTYTGVGRPRPDPRFHVPRRCGGEPAAILRSGAGRGGRLRHQRRPRLRRWRARRLDVHPDRDLRRPQPASASPRAAGPRPSPATQAGRSPRPDDLDRVQHRRFNTGRSPALRKDTVDDLPPGFAGDLRRHPGLPDRQARRARMPGPTQVGSRHSGS